MNNPDINFEQLAVPGVRELKPYEPGKPIGEVQREYGLTEVVKLASNESPLGPSSKVTAAIQAQLDELAIYPDGNAYDLKQALASHWAVSTDQITLGNGSDELVRILGGVMLDSGRNAVMSRHGFVSYVIATRAAGAELRVADANPADAPMPFGHNLDAMLALIDDATRLVFVANPNNPTGTWLSRDEMVRFLDAVPAEVVVVLDEAYFEYVEEAGYPNGVRLLEHYPNLVVLHTFSKAYGLAGLRVGCAISHPQLADLLNRVRPPFNVNALAQTAARAALADTAHLDKAVQMNRDGRVELERALMEMGLTFLPSAGNFITVDARRDGREIFELLLREGVIVRPIGGYDLPNHLRVTVGLPEENRRFIDALKKVLQHSSPSPSGRG
ncbi:MAG TPA: histidinol-phosphate transaminase [Gammaproteobacteria bacterium]|nr:histidinol-phosphate transaminase [Gammaproteobacteria bacterium]